MNTLYPLAIWAGFFFAQAYTQTHVDGTCVQFNVPVFASAPSAIYDLPSVNTSIEAASYALYTDRWSSPKGEALIIQNTTTSGVFNINANLCFPKNKGDKANTLQLATHGLGFDSRYWDPQINQGSLSYVAATLQAGYSILTYDRLGVGQSDHPDGYDVVQAPLELEILRQLTLMARNGTLYDIARTAAAQSATPCNITAQADRIVHLGHSFGSFLTSAFIALYPSLTDGALITGYILSEYLGKPGLATWALESPSTSIAPGPFVRPAGYLLSSEIGIQNIFFGGDPETAFTPEMLSYGNAIKQPVTIGEVASAFQIVGLPAPDLVAPIQFMLAEFDFYVCQGNCVGAYDPRALQFTYPNVTALEVYIQPNSGHGLTLHNNATAGYQVMFDFLERQGL